MPAFCQSCSNVVLHQNTGYVQLGMLFYPTVERLQIFEISLIKPWKRDTLFKVALKLMQIMVLCSVYRVEFSNQMVS